MHLHCTIYLVNYSKAHYEIKKVKKKYPQIGYRIEKNVLIVTFTYCMLSKTGINKRSFHVTKYSNYILLHVNKKNEKDHKELFIFTQTQPSL